MCTELNIIKQNNVVCLGDFGIDALDEANKLKIEQLNIASGCEQKVNQSTTKTGSVLDLFFFLFVFFFKYSRPTDMVNIILLVRSSHAVCNSCSRRTANLIE